MQILHGSLIYGIQNKVEFKEMLIWKKEKVDDHYTEQWKSFQF